jgi:hypothetical protein
MPIDPQAIDPGACYTFAEAASFAGVTRRTVDNWMSKKLFQPLVGQRGRGRRLYIRGADLLRLVVGTASPVRIESAAQRKRRDAATDQWLRAQGVLVDE